MIKSIWLNFQKIRRVLLYQINLMKKNQSKWTLPGLGYFENSTAREGLVGTSWHKLLYLKKYLEKYFDILLSYWSNYKQHKNCKNILTNNIPINKIGFRFVDSVFRHFVKDFLLIINVNNIYTHFKHNARSQRSITQQRNFGTFNVLFFHSFRFSCPGVILFLFALLISHMFY